MICDITFVGTRIYELTTILYPQVRVPLNTAREWPKTSPYSGTEPLSSSCRSEHGRVQRGVQDARSGVQSAGEQFEYDVERWMPCSTRGFLDTNDFLVLNDVLDLYVIF